MTASSDANLWATPEHAFEYLRRADTMPHRAEAEAALTEWVPAAVERVLDLGTGAGRLIDLLRPSRREAHFVALDFSPLMLDVLHERFASDPGVTIVAHDFDQPLPPMGQFDAVVSSFAIHHLMHPRKRELYAEVFGVLAPGGIFCNLEHVASPTAALHESFLRAIGITREEEDPSNKLLDLDTQLGWLREIGFQNVDCHWKWRELALFSGTKPA